MQYGKIRAARQPDESAIGELHLNMAFFEINLCLGGAGRRSGPKRRSGAYPHELHQNRLTN